MKIHAIQTGIVHVRPSFLRGSVAAGSNAAFLFKLFTDRTWLDLPIYCWAIEHDEGVIVVDSGDRASTQSNFISQSTYTIRPDEEIGQQLAALGIKSRDVSRVILTHLHGDHVNGLAALPGVPTYLSAIEHAYYQSRFGGIFVRRTTRLPRDFAPIALTKREQPIGGFPFIYPITKAGDVFGVPTPGHTAGHMSVVAMIDGIAYFLAGDVTYNLQGLVTQTLQGPSLDAKDHPATLRTVLDFARATPTVYLPAHDWKSGERLAAREVVSVS